MKSIIFFLCTLFLIMNSAYASCQWSYLNQLNKDIKHAQDLLSDYSTCRSNCKGLETGLISSLSKMSHKSSCGAHIFTASNVETINFIGGRFRLIQKQKTSSTWASGVLKKPVKVIAAIPKALPKVVVIAPKITAKPRFIKPVYKRAPQITLVKAPEAPRAIQQTRMMITKEAYKELYI